MREQFTIRAIAVYLILVPLTWALLAVLGGATYGLIGGLSLARNAEYQQKSDLFFKEKGINFDRKDGQALPKLSDEDMQQWRAMRWEGLSHVNWFAPTLLLVVVSFGVVGFLGGLIAKAWLLVGIVPAAMWLMNNPHMKFQMSRDLSSTDRMLLVLVQIGTCYLLSYFGYRVALKRGHRTQGTSPPKLLASQQRTEQAKHFVLRLFGLFLTLSVIAAGLGFSLGRYYWIALALGAALGLFFSGRRTDRWTVLRGSKTPTQGLSMGRRIAIFLALSLFSFVVINTARLPDSSFTSAAIGIGMGYIIGFFLWPLWLCRRGPGGTSY